MENLIDLGNYPRNDVDLIAREFIRQVYLEVMGDYATEADKKDDDRDETVLQRIEELLKSLERVIILLDGNDDTQLLDLADQGYLYFKRELSDYSNLPSNIKPITFSYPEEKIGRRNKNKTQKRGTVIPGDESTYIFRGTGFSLDMEKRYYKDYNKSYFGLTEKKAGWDCMRHYEIMGNYCLPYFPDLAFCPKNALYNYPKELILEGNKLMHSFNETKYYNLLEEMFKYFKKHLTTKAVAKELINRI